MFIWNMEIGIESINRIWRRDDAVIYISIHAPTIRRAISPASIRSDFIADFVAKDELSLPGIGYFPCVSFRTVDNGQVVDTSKGPRRR